VFMDVVLDSGGEVPTHLGHRLSLTVENAPPGSEKITEEVPAVEVDDRDVAVGQNPLRGQGFVSADSCCSHRHRRAALSIDNQIYLAQRFAVDWEQVDDSGRIYQGDQAKVASYAIYGEDIHAFADSTVLGAVDGLPDQVPPEVTNVNLQNADGNQFPLDQLIISMQ
jgi:hypothetical protein